MHKLRGLQGMTGQLAGHLRSGELAKLAIDLREQSGRSFSFASMEGVEQAGEIGHSGGNTELRGGKRLKPLAEWRLIHRAQTKTLQRSFRPETVPSNSLSSLVAHNPPRRAWSPQRRLDLRKLASPGNNVLSRKKPAAGRRRLPCDSPDHLARPHCARARVTGPLTEG